MLAALSLLAFLVFGSPHAGSAPTPYGHDFVRAGQAWPDAAPPELPRQAPAADPAQEAEFLLQLDALERAGGPYSDGLAEPLAALAHLHRERGEWEEALDLYRRAQHVVRINDGLYSQRQIPLLRGQLDTYRLSGDMEALDDRYQYFFRLYGRGEPPYTELRMRATLEYLRWQREWLRLELDSEEKSRRRLLDLYQLNDRLIEEAGRQASLDGSWYQSLVLSQVRNLYLIKDQVKPEEEYVGGAPAAPIMPANWSDKDVYEHRLEGLQRGALTNGARLLTVLIEREYPVTAEQKARWYLELGDWYQWNDSHARAAEHYRMAWQLLQREGEGRRLHEWLGQPVELPDNGAFWQQLTGGAGTQRVVVSASYDVSARGRVRNLKTLALSEGDERLASRLRRKLSNTRFRPRFIAGRAEESLGISRDYEIKR